ncbi:hypothetical protein [Jeongeupia sp. USM3]|uniref:hypothetical protein n=1 Tax=Jeongeupia sp. USM3 TaxID=1906741 RepID=UPI0014394B6E|nr:hypothetical protein [Jeongeupia sp. USM3]
MNGISAESPRRRKFIYMAFVANVFSGYIIGLHTRRGMHTESSIDVLEQDSCATA